MIVLPTDHQAPFLCKIQTNIISVPPILIYWRKSSKWFGLFMLCNSEFVTSVGTKQWFGGCTCSKTTEYSRGIMPACVSWQKVDGVMTRKNGNASLQQSSRPAAWLQQFGGGGLEGWVNAVSNFQCIHTAYLTAYNGLGVFCSVLP